MTVLKTKSEDMKMRGYDDLTQAIFDVKSAIFGKPMPKKPEGAEDKGDKGNVDEKELVKESKQLKDISVKLHKQALIEFRYEKARFSKLGLAKPSPVKDSFGGLFGGDEPDDDDTDDGKSGGLLGKLLGKLKGKIKDLFKKLMKGIWRRIKTGIKRLIGRKGRLFIKSIKKLFRRIKVNFKLFRRFAFKPFRQARRFVQSLPKKAFNLTKNVVKRGVSAVKTQLLKRGGIKGIKSSVGKVVKNTGKMLLKRFKLFYKAGPGRFIKKIPLVGSIIDFAINYFIFKEPLGKAVLKAAGAGIGAWAGGLAAAAAGSVIPFLGTAVGGTLGAIAGGMIGDALGGLLYDLIVGGGKGAKTETITKTSKISIVNGQIVEDSTSVETTTDGAKEGAKVKKPQFVLVGEGGEDEWIVPKSRLGWWIAPLVGDIIEESVDEEQQENAKLKRETDKISEESVENVEETEEKTESKTWKPGKIFDPVIKLSKFFEKKSNNIKEMMSIISSQERIIDKLKPVDEPDTSIDTPPVTTPQPAKTTLNNIDPDPEPDYAEVVPSLLTPDTSIMTQQSQLVPFPIPVGVDGGSAESYAVWGRKVVGN